LGDRFGQMCLPLPLAILGVNPVGAIRDLTPGGAAIDNNSSAYRTGGDHATILAVTLSAGAGGGGASRTATTVADEAIVVRGGTGPMPTPGTIFSGSYGATLEEAASGVPHGTIRSTTAGAVRSGGGAVDAVPELTRSGVLNTRHVNIIEGRGPTTFSQPFPNPVPRGGRAQ